MVHRIDRVQDPGDSKIVGEFGGGLESSSPITRATT